MNRMKTLQNVTARFGFVISVWGEVPELVPAGGLM